MLCFSSKRWIKLDTSLTYLCVYFFFSLIREKCYLLLLRLVRALRTKCRCCCAASHLSSVSSFIIYYFWCSLLFIFFAIEMPRNSERILEWRSPRAEKKKQAKKNIIIFTSWTYERRCELKWIQHKKPSLQHFHCWYCAQDRKLVGNAWRYEWTTKQRLLSQHHSPPRRLLSLIAATTWKMP